MLGALQEEDKQSDSKKCTIKPYLTKKWPGMTQMM